MSGVDGQGVLPAWTWSWDDAVEVTDDAGWALMAENGFGSAIAFIAGPPDLGRRRADDAGRTVHVTLEHPDGTTEEHDRPFTAADRAVVDESAQWYLDDWGIPPRPSGHDWFVRMPPGWDDPVAFERELTSRMIDLAQLQELPGTVVVAELYRGLRARDS